MKKTRPNAEAPLTLYQAVADDIRYFHHMSKPKKDRENSDGQKMREWVPVDDTRDPLSIPFEHSRASFPPQNFSGVETSQDVWRTLIFAFNRLEERPRELLNLSESEALAKIIDIPTITSDVIDALAAGERTPAKSLGYEVDRIFGLQGQLEQFSVAPNPKDASIVDLPFKMDALPYTGHLPDHGQLVGDLYRHHRTDGTGIVKSLRITGLSSQIVDYIRVFPVDRDLFDAATPEPVFGWKLSRRMDREFYGMHNGPFTHYCAARMAIQDKANPDNPQHRLADPVQVYDFPATARYTYFDLYRPDDRPPAYSRRNVSLNRKRKKSFQKLDADTRDKLDTASYGLRFSTVLGLTPPKANERAILASDLTLQPLTDVTSLALPAQLFISPEQRKKEYETVSSLQKDWVFANQTARGTKGFTTAFNQAMIHLHQMLAPTDPAKADEVNPDTALGAAFQPVTADGKRVGAPTFYVASNVVDSMIANGLLVARQTSHNYKDYINRAIPA